MNNVNYHYHKFAGYVLFPFRLSLLLTSILSTSLLLYTLDKLSFKIVDDYTTKISHSLIIYNSKLICNLMGFTIHRSGSKITDKPCLFVGNHINFFDSPLLITVLNKCNLFVANLTYNKFPLSSFYKTQNNILCDPNKRMKTVDKMKDRLKKGKQINIFSDACDYIPEGKLIAPFKTGAFVTKSPIQPFIIRYVPSSNTNMNYNDNTPFNLVKSYLLDGDMQVYVKILPLQYYKDSYKSHEDYRDEIYELMTKELSLLPEQKPNLLVGEPSNEYIMNYLIYILYLSGFCYLIGNTLYCSSFLMNFIASYFCHFYPTKNTCLIDTLSILSTFTSSSFKSIQNDYDFYFRCLFMIFTLTRGYNWLQYKNDKPFDVKKHVWNTWIPMYTFSLYPLLLNTLELYNII